MEYQEVLNFLFSQLPMYQRTGKAAYKANLDNTYRLDDYLNHPHTNYRTIHVAGTNGKGSVSHTLASVLQATGMKVGLYTSPHLKDFRERIKVNGECISEEDVISFVTENKSLIEEVQPSFFEMTVAMAFNYFAIQKIDVAVVEVGLGGRLDSTNIINPDCSVITNIGLDHVALLGNTLEQIASEKGGIIKPGVPVVIGEYLESTKKVFENIATAKQSDVFYAEDIYDIPVGLKSVDMKQVFQVYKGGEKLYSDLKLDLLGFYQQKNIKTVLAVLDVLKGRGYNITEENIYNGMERVVQCTGLMGRWQVLSVNPLVVCDTGHNTDGVSCLVEQIEQTAYKRLHMIWGMVNDKDINGVLELLPQDATYYFAAPDIPRGKDAVELKAMALTYGLKGESYTSVAAALEKAKKNSGPNDLIFIGGSTFVVAEVV